MPESAKQSAYLESSIIWGQIWNDLFEAAKFQLHKGRNARDGKIAQSVNANTPTISEKSHEELKALLHCNFMNALLFAGPSNIMAEEDECLEKQKIELKGINVRLLQNLMSKINIVPHNLLFDRTPCILLCESQTLLKKRLARFTRNVERIVCGQRYSG